MHAPAACQGCAGGLAGAAVVSVERRQVFDLPETRLPDAAISAFSYLRAVQADDVEAAREFAGTEPRMPERCTSSAALFQEIKTALLKMI